MTSPASTATTSPRPASNWAGVAVVALGIFVMITVEELPIGLLGLMADDLDVSPGIAGQAVTLPGLMAAATALATPLLIRRLDRRHVLAGGLAIMVAGTAVTATAASFAVVLVSRLTIGVSIGLFWALAAPAATRLVRHEHRTTATAVVFGGASAGTVLGVPLGTGLGSFLGWRTSFWVVATSGAVVALLVLFLVQRLPSEEAASPRAVLDALRNPALLPVFAVTTVLVTGQFIAYTYASQIVTGIGALGQGFVGPALLTYGLAGLLGSIAIAVVLTRSPRAGVLLVAGGVALVLTAIPALLHGPISALTLMLAWGLMTGGLGASLQSWVAENAPGRLEIATALNTAAFNASIAFGALLGGGVLDTRGIVSVVHVGAVLCAIAFAMTLATSLRRAR